MAKKVTNPEAAEPKASKPKEKTLTTRTLNIPGVGTIPKGTPVDAAMSTAFKRAYGGDAAHGGDLKKSKYCEELE